MTILVVDDEPAYRLLLKDLLTHEGHDVLLAGNGQETLEKMEAIRVDFVVSDVYMPVMDGLKFHKVMRSSPRWEKIPFLFVSAYDDQHTLEAVKNPKLERFIKKGRPTKELTDWIKYLTLPENERPKLAPGLRTNPPLGGVKR